MVSAARTLVLADYVPANTRGVTLSAPALAWIPKQAADRLDFSLDATGLLAAGDSFASIQALISPSGGLTDLFADDMTAIGPVITLWLAAGDATVVYAVSVLAVTAAGLRMNWYPSLTVVGPSFEAGVPVANSVPSTLAYNLCNDTSGALLTDTSGITVTGTPRVWAAAMVGDTYGRSLTDTRGRSVLAAS